MYLIYSLKLVSLLGSFLCHFLRWSSFLNLIFLFGTELHLNFLEIFHRNRILLEVPKFHFRLPPDLGPVVNCDSDLIFWVNVWLLKPILVEISPEPLYSVGRS